MGGPINIYEYEKYSWVREEKGFLEKAIAQGSSNLDLPWSSASY
jgi:hypothetical protein